MIYILIADDDAFFRKALKTTLEREKFNVIEAPDGKTARSILSSARVDLVISDIQMPFFTGVELLEWITSYKQIPVILMTGFSNLIETQKASGLGAAGFFSKPFSVDELIETTKRVLKLDEKQEPPKVSVDDEYCKVSIDDFIMGKQIQFGVSIRLSPTKYVKVAHKGENVDLGQIKAYKSKGIKFLYVKKDEYAQLVGFNLKLAKAMQKSPSISLEKKKEFLKFTGEVVLEQAFVGGLNESAFEAAKDFLDTALSVVSEDDESFGLLMRLSSHSELQYAHALGVSSIMVMIGQNLNWNSPASIFKISLAGLFHDIGKKEMPKEMFEKPRHLYTAEERALLESHPTRGKDILQTLRAMPQDVIQATYEHHENVIGHGYPRRLRKVQIHPFARLIFLADLFCNYAIRSTFNDPISPAEACRKIEMFHSEEIDPEMFHSLKKLVER